MEEMKCVIKIEENCAEGLRESYSMVTLQCSLGYRDKQAAARMEIVTYFSSPSSSVNSSNLSG